MTSEVFYTMTIGFLKLSIFALYRVYFPLKTLLPLHLGVQSLLKLTVLWPSLSNQPGDDSDEDHRIPARVLQSVPTVCNIITDFIILLLLVRQIDDFTFRRRGRDVFAYCLQWVGGMMTPHYNYDSLLDAPRLFQRLCCQLRPSRFCS
jgi:hypothetical protein